MNMSALDADLVSRRSPLSSPRRISRVAPALRPRHPWLIATMLTLIVGALGWAFLAPRQLGGSTSYVITDGTSMLPNFHAGDLVLLRRQPGYQVGEVAGYHSTRLGVTVMHRIVAIDGTHYVFKGDNNSWRDTEQPVAADIVGAEWMHLAGWGSVLLDLHTPVVAAAVLGLLWTLVMWPRSSTRRQRRRRRHAH